MITYEPKNIDFPRNNYILSTDIRYKSSVYYQDGHPLDTPSFYDEKMIGLPEKFIEEYDVLIDRGSSAAFERHLVLSEIETFQDLELFRNNMFNI
jgi:hypothetical protein